MRLRVIGKERDGYMRCGVVLPSGKCYRFEADSKVEARSIAALLITWHRLINGQEITICLPRERWKEVNNAKSVK